MIDTEIKLIDSNILVYACDNSEEVKNKIASKLLESIAKNQMNIAFSTQNFSEFYSVVTKKIQKPMKPEEAKQIIKDLSNLSNIEILKINPETILNAIDISNNNKISYWDALIASVMQENNINTIITENEVDFKKIPGLKVINPFK